MYLLNTFWQHLKKIYLFISEYNCTYFSYFRGKNEIPENENMFIISRSKTVG